MEKETNLNQNQGFSQLKIPEISLNTVENSSFDEFGKEKIDSLKKSVSEIKELVKERQMLSKNIHAEGEKIKTEINNFLLENVAVEDDRDAIKEKNELRTKKIAISELQLNEKVDCWKDVALLKKELRDNERELIEKESRLKTLNKILSEE